MFHPKNSLENSKRGVQCTHMNSSKTCKRWGSMYSPEIALDSLYNNRIMLKITEYQRHLIGSYVNIPDQIGRIGQYAGSKTKRVWRLV